MRKEGRKGYGWTQLEKRREKGAESDVDGHREKGGRRRESEGERKKEKGKDNENKDNAPNPFQLNFLYLYSLTLELSISHKLSSSLPLLIFKTMACFGTQVLGC